MELEVSLMIYKKNSISSQNKISNLWSVTLQFRGVLSVWLLCLMGTGDCDVSNLRLYHNFIQGIISSSLGSEYYHELSTHS